MCRSLELNWYCASQWLKKYKENLVSETLCEWRANTSKAHVGTANAHLAAEWGFCCVYQWEVILLTLSLSLSQTSTKSCFHIRTSFQFLMAFFAALSNIQPLFTWEVSVRFVSWTDCCVNAFISKRTKLSSVVKSLITPKICHCPHQHHHQDHWYPTIASQIDLPHGGQYQTIK